MNMIRYDDKRMQLVMALAAVVLQRLEKQFGVCCYLEQTPAMEGRAGHKVSSRSI